MKQRLKHWLARLAVRYLGMYELYRVDDNKWLAFLLVMAEQKKLRRDTIEWVRNAAWNGTDGGFPMESVMIDMAKLGEGMEDK